MHGNRIWNRNKDQKMNRTGRKKLRREITEFYESKSPKADRGRAERKARRIAEMRIQGLP